MSRCGGIDDKCEIAFWGKHEDAQQEADGGECRSGQFEDGAACIVERSTAEQCNRDRRGRQQDACPASQLVERALLLVK
jgi:hypothetical protein